MAKSLTPVDCYALMNSLVEQATGQKDLEVVDTSSFVSAGERVLATGYENVVNSLSLVLGRTLVAVRPYKARMMNVQAFSTGEYTHRLRKISYYSRKALPAGNWNTQLYPENLMQGKTNAADSTSGHESTKSMWVQNQPQALEMNFAGSDVWQESTTVYQYQLKQAFRDETSFSDFIAGIMTEKANDIESEKEAFSRMAVLNKIGDVFLTGNAEQKINLTKAFNDEFGTAYTSEELRTTHLTEFLEFFVATFKITSDKLTERSAAYHRNITKSVVNPETGDSETLYILRHTPKDAQKVFLFNPLFVKAKAQVMPAIFNPEYLDIGNYEGVDYWQANYSDSVRPQVNIYPAIYDSVTGTQIKGEQVQIPYVVGMIFDRDAILVDFQMSDEGATATPLEARKHYYNLWWSFAKNAINDPTENCVIFYMDDESEGSNKVGEAIVGTAEAGD